MTRRRAKDFFHEKLKTWIDLHGARRSGIVVEKQNDSFRQGLSVYHDNLPLTGGTSSSNLVDFFGQTVCYVYGCVFASGKNLYSTGE